MTYKIEVYQPKTPWTDGGYAPEWTDNAPANRVVVHRTGNPWATGESTCRWYDNQRGGSSHAVADGGMIYQVILPPHHMWHVLASAAAATKGYPVSDPAIQGGRARGDIRAYGIEGSEDFNSTGQAKRRVWLAYRQEHKRASSEENRMVRSGAAAHWTDETLTTLVERVGDILLGVPWFEGNIDDVYAHSEFDPITRPHDFDAFMPPDDFRERVSDYLARIRRAQAATPPPPAIAGTAPVTPAEAQDGALEARVVALERGAAALEREHAKQHDRIGNLQQHINERLQAIAHAAEGSEA